MPKLNAEDSINFISTMSELGHCTLRYGNPITFFNKESELVQRHRSFVLLNILPKIISISRTAYVYEAMCVLESFDHCEKDHLSDILCYEKSNWQIRLTENDLIAGFPDFWLGTMQDSKSGKGYCSGAFLFHLNSRVIDFSEIISCFNWAYLIKNQMSTLGRGLTGRAKKYLMAHPDEVLLAWFGGSNLVFLPGSAVLSEVAAQIVKNLDWRETSVL